MGGVECGINQTRLILKPSVHRFGTFVKNIVLCRSNSKQAHLITPRPSPAPAKRLVIVNSNAIASDDNHSDFLNNSLTEPNEPTFSSAPTTSSST